MVTPRRRKKTRKRKKKRRRKKRKRTMLTLSILMERAGKKLVVKQLVKIWKKPYPVTTLTLGASVILRGSTKA